MRVSLVLAVASILLVAALADPSMEAASAQKYDKKSHKEHKYEKEHKDKPDSYKPDRPEGYKPDGYKPDGYKPDSYKPERPNGYKPVDYEEYKYGKDAYTKQPYSKEPYGKNSYGKESYGKDPYGKEPYGSGPYEEYSGGYNNYESYGEYSEDPMYGRYGQPSPYDGGYWGGRNGRQIIHLQAVYAENLLNSSLIQPGARTPATDDQKCEANGLDKCDEDFGLICAWRHHDSSSSKGSDYSTGKYGPIFQSAPVTPTALGKGWFNWYRDNAAPLNGVDLVTFNGHQIGYKWATVNGFMTFEDNARNCHPLLGPNTAVTFNSEYVPVYLIFGKIQLPVDPAMVIPLGGYGYINERKQGSAAEILSKDNEYADKPDTSSYKSTPEGNKYKIEGNTAYVYNEKDNTLCGLSLVARGDVKLTVTRTGMSNLNYAGSMEWPIVWTDLITTLPLLIGDNVEAPARRDTLPIIPIILPTFDVADVAVLYIEKTLDRIAAVCKTNDDIPWITPGAITLDVAPSP